MDMRLKHLIHTLILSFLLAIPLVSIANQSMIDSLEAVKNKLDIEEKVDVVNQLSELYFIVKQTDKAKDYAYEALELSKSKGYKEGLAEAYNRLGAVYQYKKDDENAMSSYFKALDIYNAQQNKKGIAITNNHVGEVFIMKDEIPQAIEKFKSAEKTLKNLNDQKHLAKVYKNLGEASLLKETPEYGPAKKFLNQSFKLELAQKNYEQAAKIAREIAGYDINLKDYESAMIYLRSTMETYQGLGDQQNIAEVYHTMGEVYLLQNFPEDAINFFNKAVAIRTGINDKIGLAQSYKSIGFNHLKLGKKKEAAEFLNKAGLLIKEIPVSKEGTLVLQQIAGGYESLGDTQKSLNYYKQYNSAKEEYAKIEKKKSTLDLAAMYNSKFEARDKQNKIDRLQLENKSNKTFRNFLALLILLSFALLAVLYNSFRRKKADNQLLTTKNQEIENQNSIIEEKNATLDTLNGKLVNEMAERESVEQSSFARDRFLATMSNEMRTPLNIISGLTHLLLTNDPRKDQIENLRTLQFSANNLVVFINDVLDFSNIEAGKISFDKLNFNPKKTLEEIKDRFSLPAKDKGIDLHIRYDENLPKELNGDPTRLNQVITNLVSTSLKYTNHGQIDIGVKMHELINNKLTLLLTVKDTGEGIEKEQLDKMFQKFSRSAEDMYDGYGSSGLGLAICKRLVDLQNGKIEATSSPENGTEFNIYLPYTLEEKKANTQIKNQTFDHLAGNKILVVEDNKINQLVVAKMLKKLNMEVVTADNGQEALEAMNHQYFDLVLMDIQMPIMDGYRATAEIRKSVDPRVRDIPIIALTASAYLTEKEKAKLFGMDDHVGKPFGPDDLMIKISHHIKMNEPV